MNSSDTPRPFGGILAIVFIFLITATVHVIGSAALAIIVSDMSHMPILAFFGWFFVLPELVGVTVQWILYDPARGSRSFWRVMLVSVPVACVLVAAFGPKEQGDAIRWTSAYVIGTVIGASWSMLLVALTKRFVIALRTNRVQASPGSRVC